MPMRLSFQELSRHSRLRGVQNYLEITEGDGAGSARKAASTFASRWCSKRQSKLSRRWRTRNLGGTARPEFVTFSRSPATCNFIESSQLRPFKRAVFIFHACGWTIKRSPLIGD